MLSVKQYQLNLKHYYGYYTGTIDGSRGPKTIAAIKAFQRDHGLTVDGVYGPKTDARLIAAIKAMQAKLGVTQDGKVGSKTIAAIKAVQKRYGLVQDGICGAKTSAKLNGSSSSSSGGSSAHFKKSEFRCGCRGKYCSGYPATVSSKLLNILEGLRSIYGRPITVTSGLRCTTYNRQVGGISNSAHKTGKAADIYIPGICDTAAGRKKVVAKAYELGAKYSYCNTSGMGNAVHINV